MSLKAASHIPLSLYIHFPWCVKKCPYCDFNSHVFNGEQLPEDQYIDRLLVDLDADLQRFQEERPLTSIFLGGGTPSLFKPASIAKLITGIHERLDFVSDIEVTLEANPGTADKRYFHGYKDAGINRLSIGVQSFSDLALKRLGRIHSAKEALNAIELADQIGFDAINLDLMFCLPEQTLAEAGADIKMAISIAPKHLSYYQLTIEENTYFYKQPPQLPKDKVQDDIAQLGEDYLNAAGFKQYEVSAWHQNSICKHNYNYWQYGDYLGIGAGAHGKITVCVDGGDEIMRFSKHKNPNDYLQKSQSDATSFLVAESDKSFDFMLNALRLKAGVPLSFLERSTLKQVAPLMATIDRLIASGDLSPISEEQQQLKATTKGFRFLNTVLSEFLP